MDLFRRCYRLLLRAYPAHVREACGSEMEEVCIAGLRRQRRKWGMAGVALGWMRILVDTAWHAALLRLRREDWRVSAGTLPYGGSGGGWRLVWEDARSAVRHLGRARGFTLTAVATLALGIGLTTAVFGAVYSLLLRPLPGVENPEALVHVYRTRGKDARFLPSSIPLLRDLGTEQEAFTGVAGWAVSSLSVTAGDRVERVLAEVVSADFFEVLGVTLLEGRGFSGSGGLQGPAKRVVVVSERFWRSHLGGVPGVVGMTLRINGTQWEIIGVAPAAFRGPIPVLAPLLWVPLSMHPELMGAGDLSQSRGNNFLGVIARVRSDQGKDRLDQWASRFSTRLQGAFPEFYEDVRMRVHPQARAGIHPAVRSTQAGLSGVVMGVVALLLLVACVNVAGLFLAKAQSRRKEVAVRRSLGAPRCRLVSQFLFESLALSLAAGIVGFVLADMGVHLMNRIDVPFDQTLEWNLTLDGPVLAFNLGVTLLVSMIFGLAPALRLSSPDLVGPLEGRSAHHPGKPLESSWVLVGGQVAVATVLLVCAGLFARNLRDALAVDTGFRHTNLVLATFDPGSEGYDRGKAVEMFSRLLERARAIPGVESAGLASFVPLGMASAQQLLEIPGHRPSGDESMNVQYNVVDAGYFATMDIPLAEGRGFVDSDRDGRAAIVNRRFAERFWPGRSPVGETFSAGGRAREVVGVVPTGRYGRLGEDPMPFMYFPWPAIPSSSMTLHVRTAVDPAAVLPALRGVARTIAPGVPVDDLKTMEDHLSFALLPARLGAIALGAFGALCLLLLSVGIHGVVAYSVSRRTREMGIRVAMGAHPRSVTALVLADEARVVAAGVVAGMAAALALSRVLESFLYSGDALDPAVWVVAPLVLVAVATVASYVPARRAATVDPARALREE